MKLFNWLAMKSYDNCQIDIVDNFICKYVYFLVQWEVRVKLIYLYIVYIIFYKRMTTEYTHLNKVKINN